MIPLKFCGGHKDHLVGKQVLTGGDQSDLLVMFSMVNKIIVSINSADGGVVTIRYFRRKKLGGLDLIAGQINTRCNFALFAFAQVGVMGSSNSLHLTGTEKSIIIVFFFIKNICFGSLSLSLIKELKNLKECLAASY